MNYETSIEIGGKLISAVSQTYFIADIAANHDGDIERAKDLIYLAKEAGADCAKFQHFKADKIVSDYGFSRLGELESHQSQWKDSVASVYEAYHTRREWTAELVRACFEADIEFMTTPYDVEAIEMLDEHVNAYKVGSGDITFLSFLDRMAAIQKPILLATGASNMDETARAVDVILKQNPQLALMQCNTNYTGSLENFKCVNLNVLKSFATKWPGMVLGLSDHTPGHSAVLGAVALGARLVEKHFTDDNCRTGPDHKFALNPSTWREMVIRTRELEASLGDGVKRVEENEANTVIVQRRALRLTTPIEEGQEITADIIEALRPCPMGAFTPAQGDEVIGRKALKSLDKGEALTWENTSQ